MESWPPRRRAWPGPLPAPRLLGLILFPWTLPLAGAAAVHPGARVWRPENRMQADVETPSPYPQASHIQERSVTHTGLPILVSLANRAVSFSCSITYPYTPKFKDFRVSYFHVDLQGQTSSEKKISCQPGPGSENQTHTTACPIFLKLPNSSATGTYYCSVHWQDSRMIGEGTFILVRDTGYQEPPQSPQKLLLFCFVGILAVLSILATALLLWKKRQIWALWKHAAKRCPGPSATSSPGQPPSESVYTDLQRRETEVYDCIQSEAGSPPTSQGLLSQLCRPGQAAKLCAHICKLRTLRTFTS
ncbi:NFAT activation molecule 1 isoform X3 [Bos taurus]|uniref:NFAT activation molecule 1 isoform X3 n=2 Tax=Bos taurus TaxID=9913 RepID=UPI0028CB27AF|nr:NFAT activation molecule 1 isoform X3 [Bos taurus]